MCGYNACMRKSLLILLVSAGMTLALGAQEATVSFMMAFVKRTPQGSTAKVDFTERVNVKSGDLFKIYLQPSLGSYVYLFLHDAQDDLQVLFPGTFAAFESRSYAQTMITIPEGEEWFALDNEKGTERFYLLASAERLRTLESLATAHQKTASKKGSTVAAVNAARQALLDEIRRLIKAHSQLAAAAEKPVTIGGGTRGITEAVAKLATRIEAGGFYSRTFRLDH